MIQLKVFFKELCLANIDWDEELSGTLLHKWESMIRSLLEAPTLSIPRFYLHGIDMKSASLSLHGYCDASKEAYAAVIYLVARDESHSSVNLWYKKPESGSAARNFQSTTRTSFCSTLVKAH